MKPHSPTPDAPTPHKHARLEPIDVILGKLVPYRERLWHEPMPRYNSELAAEDFRRGLIEWISKREPRYIFTIRFESPLGPLSISQRMKRFGGRLDARLLGKNWSTKTNRSVWIALVEGRGSHVHVMLRPAQEFRLTRELELTNYWNAVIRHAKIGVACDVKSFPSMDALTVAKYCTKEFGFSSRTSPYFFSEEFQAGRLRQS